MSNVTLFNDLVENFLDFVHDILPREEDKFQLRVYKNGFNLIKKSGGSLISKHFLNYASPYIDYISNKNDEYFMNENIDAFAFINDAEDKGQAKKDGLRFREIWQTLNKEDKEVIWNYTQQLLMKSLEINNII